MYAWLADMGDGWRRELKVGDTLLVCDVGGGTTDFTLIGVAEEEGQLTLRRIAVGNHTLVGGDNMDLALAHHASAAFAAKGVNLNPWQSVALWHSCRAAKENAAFARWAKQTSGGGFGARVKTHRRNCERGFGATVCPATARGWIFSGVRSVGQARARGAFGLS